MKNELKNRREFFKEAAKKTLPILGMAVMAVAAPTLQSCKKISLGCDDVCTNACKTTCKTTCVGACKGCSGTCSSDCKGGCKTLCKGTCKGYCNKMGGTYGG